MIDDPFNPDLPCHTKADFITFLHRHDKTIILPTKLNIDDLRKLACARARELACARARLQQLDKSPSAPFDSFIRRPRRQCTLNPQPGTPPSTGKGTRISPKRAVSTPLPKGSSPGNSGGLPDSKHNSRADLHFFSATSKPPARQSPAVPSLDSRTISTPPRNKTRVKDGGQSALKQPSDRGKARVLPKRAARPPPKKIEVESDDEQESEVGSIAGSTFSADELASSTSSGNKLADSTSSANELPNSASLADEVTNSTSSADELASSTSLADELASLNSPAEELASLTSSADELSSSTSSAEELATLTSSANELATSTSSADELASSTSLVDQLASLTPLANELNSLTSLADVPSSSHQKPSSIPTILPTLRFINYNPFQSRLPKGHFPRTSKRPTQTVHSELCMPLSQVTTGTRGQNHPGHRFTTVCNIDFNLSKAPPKDSSPDEIWVPDPSFIRKAPRQRDILEAAAKLDALEKARWARAVTPPCPAAEDVVQTPVDLIELAQSDVPLSISLGSGHQNRNDLDLLKMSPDIGPLPEPISHDVPPMITLALPEPLVSDANSTDPGEFSNEFYAMFDPCSALNPDSSLNLETLEWPTPIDRTVATTFLEMKIGTSKFLRRREAASQEEVDGLTGALAKAIPKPFDNPNDLDRRFSIAAGSEIPTSANNPFTKLLGCDSIFSSPIELAKNHTKTSSISTTHTRPNRNDQLALHCLEGMCSPQDITVASARSIPKILHSPTDPVGHCLISITASSDFATFVSSLVRIVDRNSHAIGRINMLSNKNAHNQLVRYSSKGMCPPRDWPCFLQTEFNLLTSDKLIKRLNVFFLPVLDAGIARQSYSSSLANNNVYMSLPGCSTTITEPGDSVQIKPSYVRMSRGDASENVYAISTVEPPDARELRFHPSEEIYPQKSENVAFEKPEERVSTIIKSPASPSIKPRRILDLVPTNEPLIIFNAALANSDLVENALHEAISAEFN
ncbi:hypothetical protein PSTT_15057 [Puccinia striiformis]|uniref:Uncharacterized protein n=1 Tax=Puccinia striiformis TaxID=27350 RepID=A0A2S4UJP9_9BASI|nr:hypothetical protein PSTT_15057 [Puccinia striiformis]